MTATMYRQRVIYDNGDLWITTYITDIPVQTLTEQARDTINAFIKEKQYEVFTDSLELERNCPMGFWQFTVTTGTELSELEPSTD